MSFSPILDEHLRVTEELYQLCTDENRLLKHGTQDIPEPLLERKQQLLERLNISVLQLKTVRPLSPGEKARHQSGVQKAQRRIMQILALDRENEQWMLKSQSGGTATTSAPRTPMIQKIYQKYQEAPPPAPNQGS